MASVYDTTDWRPCPNRKLSEKFISDLSDFSVDWYKLGCNLEVDSLYMKTLQKKSCTDIDTCLLAMFAKWTERFEQQVDCSELCTALTNINRHDLVTIVRSRRPSTDVGIQQLLQQLTAGLSTEWFKLGIQLNVPCDQLECIKQNNAPPVDFRPLREMLMYWNKSFMGSDRRQCLIGALRESQRNDVIRWMNEKLLDEIYEERVLPPIESLRISCAEQQQQQQLQQWPQPVEEEQESFREHVDGDYDTVDGGNIGRGVSRLKELPEDEEKLIYQDEPSCSPRKLVESCEADSIHAEDCEDSGFSVV